jgi:hypothetical protein
MKIILKTSTFLILLFFSINNLTGQSACSYTESEITIKLNGWDINRTDYTHERFIEVTDINNNSELNYSGEKDTEEFGYPWYYYGIAIFILLELWIVKEIKMVLSVCSLLK